MQSTTAAKASPLGAALNSTDEEKVHYWNSADIMAVIGMTLHFHGEQEVVNGVLETEEERDKRLKAMLRRSIARLINKPYRPSDLVNDDVKKKEAGDVDRTIATLHRLKNHPNIIERCQKVVEEYKAEVALYTNAEEAKVLMQNAKEKSQEPA